MTDRWSSGGRRWLLSAGILMIAFSGCQKGGTPAGSDAGEAIYGNGLNDYSDVICKVGDLEITQQDLDLRYQELPANLKPRFSGEGWEKRFLRYMVDEALMVREAKRMSIDRDPEVRQWLISQRRALLKNQWQIRELFKDLQPDMKQIGDYFQEFRDLYQYAGAIRARDIVCTYQEMALRAHERLQSRDPANSFEAVVDAFCVNAYLVKSAGDLGWIEKTSNIPALPYASVFIERIWDWDIGLHPPTEIGGQWHVIEILERKPQRHYELDEVFDLVVADLQPRLQAQAEEQFLKKARRDVSIEFFGRYVPGEGLSDAQLFERGWYAQDVEQKRKIFTMLREDYPTSDWGDDALFMIANTYLDESDHVFATRYLAQLLQEYPESELAEDARYIMDNMRSANFTKPNTIEELRQKVRSR